MDSSKILMKLKALGKITEDDIELVRNEDEEDVRSLAATLHSLLCKADKHTTLAEYTVGVQGCDFYAEEQVSNHWILQAHIKWLEIAKSFAEYFPEYKEDPDMVIDFCNALSIMSDRKIADFLQEVIQRLQRMK